MSLVRLDVHDFDDTELGAEVRAAFAAGRTIVSLYDSSEPDQRAEIWVDGVHGLYRMRCENVHVWLTALNARKGPVQGDCPTCGCPGEWMDS